MKMTNADYQALLILLAKYKRVTSNPWNRLWLCDQHDRQEWFDRGIYDYLNDDNITTALKRAIREGV